MKYYKVVRVECERFVSLYKSNPQVYKIGERTDCPYMFIYESGDFMPEFNKRRSESGYRVLEVEVIGKVHRVTMQEVSCSIDTRIHDTKSYIDNRIIRRGRSGGEYGYIYNRVLADSIIPIRVVNLSELTIEQDEDRWIFWMAYTPRAEEMVS